MSRIIMDNKPAVSVIVDDADYWWLTQYRWLLRQFPTGFEYAVASIDGKRTYMHRLLAGVEGLHVDHINGDTLDNRRANLRAVTPAQNAQNKHVQRASKTGVSGVFEQSGRFVARVGINNRRFYLGCFATLGEAASAVATFKTANASEDGTVPALIKRIQELEAALNAATQTEAA